ncbi:hypothetical protein NEUTE2DRAFT_156204 [Neurospora tetrasperma FGSC 2509]|nr:hypothetical protein NEUTE2DRAFT_156204 [Neurospora tetrasperma FGSC 2509]
MPDAPPTPDDTTGEGQDSPTNHEQDIGDWRHGPVLPTFYNPTIRQRAEADRSMPGLSFWVLLKQHPPFWAGEPRTRAKGRSREVDGFGTQEPFGAIEVHQAPAVPLLETMFRSHVFNKRLLSYSIRGVLLVS